MAAGVAWWLLVRCYRLWTLDLVAVDISSVGSRPCFWTVAASTTDFIRATVGVASWSKGNIASKESTRALDVTTLCCELAVPWRQHSCQVILLNGTMIPMRLGANTWKIDVSSTAWPWAFRHHHSTHYCSDLRNNSHNRHHTDYCTDNK